MRNIMTKIAVLGPQMLNSGYPGGVNFRLASNVLFWIESTMEFGMFKLELKYFRQ